MLQIKGKKKLTNFIHGQNYKFSLNHHEVPGCINFSCDILEKWPEKLVGENLS
jgi:hypothetical protein